MNIEVIFTNVKRMLEYRINSSKIKFNIVYSEFDEKTENIQEKVEYKIENLNSGGHVAKYLYNKKIYKTVYMNIDINEIKTLIDDFDVIILHSGTDRKIKKLTKLNTNCQFFISSMFLVDYRSNIYFTYICKSDINSAENSNLQYISSHDFSIMYCGLRDGDVALAISMVDPTLILPQLRIVKYENETINGDVNNEN